MHLNEHLTSSQAHQHLPAGGSTAIANWHTAGSGSTGSVWSIFQQIGKKIKTHSKSPLISHADDLVVIE